VKYGGAGPSMAKDQWKKIEITQKHMIWSFLRIKNSTKYEIILAETGLYSIELESLKGLISY
jgi:hypothetical protein